MKSRSNTSTPAATSATTSLTDGLCHKLQKTHHLDKRAKDILERQPPDKGHGPDDLFTTKQVAAWLCVSNSKLNNMRSQKIGPIPTIIGTRMVLYRRSDVVAFLDNRRRVWEQGERSA